MKSALKKNVSFDETILSEDSRDEKPKKKAAPSLVVWDFRANKDVFTSKFLVDWCESNCKKWAFQLEKSDTGYEHWQGRFCLIKKRQKNVVLKLFGDTPPNYLEPTSLANSKELFFYALKADTRIGECFCDPYHEKKIGVHQKFIPKQFDKIVLRPFQQSVIDSCSVHDTRTINLLYCEKGNKGRSTIGAYAELHDIGYYLPPVNDSKELVACAYACAEGDENRTPAFFIDLPRSFDKTHLEQMYSAIEQMKVGKLYDMRYKYRSFWVNSPTIWVFTNEYPNLKLLSSDRWKIWEIDDDDELIPYDSSPVSLSDSKNQVEYIDQESVPFLRIFSAKTSKKSKAKK